MHQNSIHALTERCRLTKYPVIKLGLHEHGPFRRMNLGQEHDDLLYDLHCRAIEMWINEEDDDQTISEQQKSLIDYALYTVMLKYKDKDGEDCVIFDSMEVVDAINEHQGSSSFKIIALVREKGKETTGSIVSMCPDINAVERREDSEDHADTSIDMVESRDMISHQGKGDASVLTEQSSKISFLTKSIFGLLRRKRTTEVKGVASMKSDGDSIISAPVRKRSLQVLLFDDDSGIGASYTLSCLSEGLDEETNFASSPESHQESSFQQS